MKVALTQDIISGGGRIVVLIEIIKTLNELGYTPDVLCFRIDFTPEDIAQKYGYEIAFNILKIHPDIFFKLSEVSKVWFNLLVNRRAHAYDLIIDSNNTVLGLSSRTPIVSYVHYPRIDRVLRREALTIERGEPLVRRVRWAYRLDYWLARQLYQWIKLPHSVRWLANSEFTRTVVEKHNPTAQDQVMVVYPPVEVPSKPTFTNQRKQQVVTLGRFSVLKRQLDQIKIAQQLPHISFVLMGFAPPGNAYLEKCRRYLVKHAITNVHLRPNEPYERVLQVLRESQFFLHTLENEPFGITTVEAIAAGCIPVVHNSGGQREIVPYEKLRFNTLAEAVARLQALLEKDPAEVREPLFAHGQQFDKSEFRRNFGRILREVDVRIH